MMHIQVVDMLAPYAKGGKIGEFVLFEFHGIDVGYEGCRCI